MQEVFLLSIGVLLIVVALLPVYLLPQHASVTWWDYISPFTGVLGWWIVGWIVVYLEMRSATGVANLWVEPSIVMLGSIFVPWVRLLLFQFENKEVQAVCAGLRYAPLAIGILVRLVMPPLHIY